MRLLLFSDVHGNKKACQNLMALSEQADMVIGAGDFGQMRRAVKKTLAIFKNIEKPMLTVPGNAESYEELKEACSGIKNCHVLHGTGMKLNNFHFYGIGGGIPVTPFGNWSYDFTEKEAQKLLAACPENTVLISHSPPKGVADISSRGESLGSTAVREAVIQKNPLLVVCGHIHESWGIRENLEGSMVINPGPKGIFYDI